MAVNGHGFITYLSEDNYIQVNGINTPYSNLCIMSCGLYLTASPKYRSVSVRQWYLDQTQSERPGRRGICLSVWQCRDLEASFSLVSEFTPELQNTDICCIDAYDYEMSNCQECMEVYYTAVN